MPTYAGYPGASSSYIPSFEAGGKLQIEFSRNPKKFAINKYLKLVPVKRSVGFYLYIDPHTAGRVVNSNLADWVWPDGQEAPTGDDNILANSWKKYGTQRYAFPFMLGDKTVEQADWDIIASHSRMAAQQAMTARTRKALQVLTTAANWEGNSATATVLGGGKVDAGTATTHYIRNLIGAASEAILKNSYGVVKRSDVIAVMNPNTARQMHESVEMIDFLKQSPVSIDIVKGDVKSVSNVEDNFGLPDFMHGVRIVVEDCVFNAARPTAGISTGTPTYAFPNSQILFVSRPEGLVGSEGVPSFSTAEIFSYEDMTVETKRDADNRRQSGRVVDDNDVQLTAPATGYQVLEATDVP
jgi:hypothetical protein